MRERDIEKHLVQRVKALGGEVRKVKWVGRDGAPDRLVMLPGFRLGAKVDIAPKPDASAWLAKAAREVAAALPGSGIIKWVELKRPGLAATFPADAHERKQAREHKRMRAMGQCVVVIDSIEGVEELLR